MRGKSMGSCLYELLLKQDLHNLFEQGQEAGMMHADASLQQGKDRLDSWHSSVNLHDAYLSDSAAQSWTRQGEKGRHSATVRGLNQASKSAYCVQLHTLTRALENLRI